MKKQFFSIILLTALCAQSVNGMSRVTQFAGKHVAKLLGATSVTIGGALGQIGNDTVENSAPVVEEIVEEVMEVSNDVVPSVVENTTQEAVGFFGKLTNRFLSVKDAVSIAASKGALKAYEVKDSVVNFATSYATQLANSATVKSAQAFAQEHPLATGAIVVATPVVAVVSFHGARNAYRSYKTKKQNRLAEEAALALS